MGGSVKGTFVVSDELTITAPGLGLQPGSGHSCAEELRKGEGALHGCASPKQFGPVTDATHMCITKGNLV